MKRKLTAAVATAAVSILALTACGGGNGGSASGADGGAEGDVTLTWGGWDLDRVPEFRAMATAFNDAHPGITVTTVDYPNAEWLTAMTADLAAGSAPDIITLRGLPEFATWSAGGQLRDLSHIAADLDPSTQSRDVFEHDGEIQGLPWRQDHWVMYFNKDLFTAAGVEFPDGNWTWDDYVETARALQAGGLPEGTFPAYQHVWGDSTVAGFATVQTPGADLFAGDLDYLAPYFERALTLDSERLQPSFGTVQTGSLHHLGEFGQQRVAMVPMGSWFMSQLADPQNDVQDFEWGVVAVPQYASSTVDKPVSQSAVTGAAINAAIDESKVEAAEAFVRFLADEGGASALAGLGLVPPFTNDAVMDVMFSVGGMPTDENSRRALSNVDGRVAFPNDPKTPIVVQILEDTHSAIMSGSVPISDAITQANQRFANEAA
jgi:multiple sugar transport system substrate-binding protein